MGEKGELCLWILGSKLDCDVSDSCSLDNCKLEKLQFLGSKAWTVILGVVSDGRETFSQARSDDEQRWVGEM